MAALYSTKFLMGLLDQTLSASTKIFLGCER